MTSTYDSTGITLDRYTDVLTRLIALAESSFGESVDTSINDAQDAYLGHTLRNLALVVNDINEILQDVYDSTSVQSATGTRLDMLLSLIGLTRPSAGYSTSAVTLGANRATIVPAGTQFSTSAGVIWSLDSQATFTGVGSLTDNAVTCTVAGPYEAAIGDIDTIVTPVVGLTSVTNPAAAVAGRLRGTDAEQRANHTIAVATSGQSDSGSIYEALIALTGMVSANVEDNPTAAPVLGLNPYSIRVVCIGTATNAEIASAIHNNTVEGVPLQGDVTETHYDTITKQTTDIDWYTGVEVPIYIKITLALIPGEYDDDYQTQIKDGLVAHIADFRISEDVVYSALYQPIYTVGGFVVSELLVSTVDPPTGTVDITGSYKQLFTLDSADIDIVVS